MKVLFVSAEVVPFSKTGGLADVAFALPKALKEEDVDVRIMTLKNFHGKNVPVNDVHLTSTEVEVGWRKQFVGISTAKHEGLDYYFIDNEYYFKREGLYGHIDDGERYSYFCRAVLEAITKIDFKPDVIHFNDWHTGMIPILLKKHYSHMEEFKNVKTVFTIHNLKYQGIFHVDMMKELLNLDMSEFNSGAVEFHGDINFMKSGVNFADAITTVSKTYSEEIRDEYFGENLHDLISANSHKLHGILNGLDFNIYNPENDDRIVKNYTYKNSSHKSYNKKHLQKLGNLPIKKDIPLIAMVTRLSDQKGLDLIERIIEELLNLDIQMVVLGTGEKKYEDMFRYFGHRYSEKLSTQIHFDEELAHQIYSGADMFLMPSKFEPCGLSQMISQRYGTVPIVRETGGLKDTVEAYNKYTAEGTGFSFENYNAHELLFTVKSAIELYGDKKAWRKLVKNIMTIDTSWKKSAQEYKDIYTELLT